MQIRSVLIGSTGDIRRGGQELVDVWRKNAHASLWLDICYESSEKVSRLLRDFDIHPLAIDDALRSRHPPKIEFFDKQVFIVYRGIESNVSTLDFKHQQVALFIEKNLVISLHPKESYGVEHTLEGLSSMRTKTPLSIAMMIMRNSSQVYLDNLLDFDSRLNDLEDQLQNNGSDTLLMELTGYKSRLIKLMRTFRYHHTISQALLGEGEEFAYLGPDAHYHVINDLNDRFDRLMTLSQMHYDLSGDLIDGYLSITSHQLNVAMRVLTVITAIFVPLSFLAGLYGMNFEYIPELKYSSGYFILLGVMSLIAVILLFFFKRKKWL